MSPASYRAAPPRVGEPNGTGSGSRTQNRAGPLRGDASRPGHGQLPQVAYDGWLMPRGPSGSVLFQGPGGGRMRSVQVAGHPKQDALGRGRWTSWWSTRGETIELFFYTVLVPVDLLAVLAAFATAMQIPRWTGANVTEPTWPFLPVFLVVSPLWVAIFAMVGLYTEAGVRSRLTEASKIFVATAAPAMLLSGVDTLHTGSMFTSEQVPVLGYLLSFLFVLVGRNALQDR